MASQITSVSTVYSTVCSGADKKYQSSASLAFVRGIHRWSLNSRHKGPVRRKMFPFDNDIVRKSHLAIKWYKMQIQNRALCHITAFYGILHNVSFMHGLHNPIGVPASVILTPSDILVEMTLWSCNKSDWCTMYNSCTGTRRHVIQRQVQIHLSIA